MKNQKGFTAIELLIVIFMLAFLSGQVLCVIKFFKCDFEPSYKAEIIYGVSLITDIGTITGWMDFGK